MLRTKVALGIVCLAGPLFVFGDYLALTRMPGRSPCAGGYAPQKVAARSLTDFVLTAVQGGDPGKAYGLVTEPLRGKRSCREWIEHNPVRPFGPIDFSRSQWLPGPSRRDGLLFETLLTSSRDPAKRAVFLILLKGTPSAGYRVAFWIEERGPPSPLA
jgi:hypothetical protein